MDVAAGKSRIGRGLRRFRGLLPGTVLENQNLRLNLVAVVIGVIAGLGAVVFRFTIWMVQEVFYGTALNPGNVEFELVAVPNLFGALHALGGARLLLVPGIGGLLVGVLIALTTPAVRGHGVPEVLRSILVERGEIDPKVTVYKLAASSLAIGSGGSLGREGPIIQIGSAAGSFFGQFDIVESRHTRTLVAAGAAAGIAATFNTPIGGVMFALEILLAEFYLDHVITVVIAAVIGTAVARPILEFTPAPGVREFLVPVQYQLVNPLVELPAYVLLGVVVAVVGAGVVRLLYGVEHTFQRLPLPGWTKPAIGGVLLGASTLLAASAFDVEGLQAANWLFGVGYQTIHSSISGGLALALLVGLALMKAVGFSITIGSGSSGGVFSPSLYIGAMTGGAFGVVLHALAPSTAGAGAYALVGMGGLFAATASAPLTATIIIFELTGQYSIILPLFIVTVFGSEIGSILLNRGTIYSQMLRDQGITVQERRIGSLEDLTASDVMTTDVDTVTAGTNVEAVVDMFQESGHNGLPIVDDEGRLVGVVTLLDVNRAYASKTADRDDLAEETLERTVEDVGTTTVVTSSPNSNLLGVVDCMERAAVGRIPIVDDDGELVGIVTRSDVLDAYDRMPAEY